jgi:hypothetical protein
MNIEQKAVQACANYVRLRTEIKRLSAAIGEAIEYCPGVTGKRRRADTHGGITFWTIDDRDDTHLKTAYACDTDEDGRYFLTKTEQQEILSACSHCLAAHNAIQARKAARKSLGAVKRQITMIGRKAQQQ